MQLRGMININVKEGGDVLAEREKKQLLISLRLGQKKSKNKNRRCLRIKKVNSNEITSKSS